MFTVKATYRGETRKLSFPECTSFPSFDQLYNQLYRVFPISHSYFLSRLLFSPDSTNSRILLSREVHSAEEYGQAIAQFTGRHYPKPLLRFSVFDETPHKIRNISSIDGINARRQVQHLPTTPTATVTGFPPISMSHIPPPPIIYSSYSPTEANKEGGAAALAPQQTASPQFSNSSKETVVAVETLISQFKNDLDDILKKTLSVTSGASDVDMFESKPSPHINPVGRLCLYKFCLPCGKIFQGPWYSCVKCTQVTCLSCRGSATVNASMCPTGFGPHVYKRETCPACPKTVQLAESPIRTMEIPPPGQSPIFRSMLQPSNLSGPTPHSLVPLSLPPAPVSLPPVPAPASVSLPLLESVLLPSAPLPHTSTGSTIPNATGTTRRAPIVESSPMTQPVIHNGVRCDVCNTNPIQGARHKCLDCPDYDLCTPCIESGFAERHNPFHEFFEINEPGRVVVHTVNSRELVPQASENSPPEPVVHNATCDLCDSRIVGERYKCCTCPDFDSCKSCFSITKEQHPGHSFVKVKETSDYLPADNIDRPLHYASCNECLKGIYGVRFKCMHPNCPDFDLCEDCETHPIPVHPRNHPMLKMKTSDTLIPTVYRAGQDEPVLSDTVQATHMQNQLSPQLPTAEPLFDHGYMVNPARGTTSSTSEPVAPPSPFFYAVSRTPSPPMLIPGAMPNLDVAAPSVPQVALPLNTPLWADFEKMSISQDPMPSLLPPWRTAPSDTAAPGPKSEDSLAPSLESSFTSSKLQLPPLSLNESSLWPRSSELLHLLDHKVEHLEPAKNQSTLFGNAIEDSPLTGKEPLLSRPESASKVPEVVASKKGPLALAALLDGYESASPLASSVASAVESDMVSEGKEKDAEFRNTMQAEFVSDVTVPDGQVFPPGAEFVKCWKMVNSGKIDWPENTALVFLAGESLSRQKGLSSQAVQVGAVKAGQEVEVSTDELKAPEVPGRYVSYWRLRDGDTLFGDNIWLDIVVGETSNDSSESSMSSSSVIVMPQLADDHVEKASTHPTATSTAGEDTVSDAGSDASSISLVSIPSSEEEAWEDTRELVPEAGEYVVLFDESSEEE